MRIRQEYGSDPAEVTAMRSLVRAACQRHWPAPADEPAIGQLELALSEAAANIIRHAYRGAPGCPIELVLDVEGDQARLTLLHGGQDFDPQAVPPPVFDGTRATGFGLYLMQQSVDEITYLRGAAGHRGVVLLKRRPKSPITGSAMQILVDQVGDVTVVAPIAEQIEVSNADEFRRQMGPVLQNCRKLVLDLHRVQFMDSHGCGAIISCLKHLAAVGGDLKICRVTQPVQNVFDLIRLHRICEICPTRDAAVQAFDARSPHGGPA